MSDDWFAPIRAYCERGDAGFWAEPLNAVSNAAFLVAAIAALRLVGSGPRRDPAAVMLATLVGVVGIGSFLFHTFATRWSLLADVVPIALFIHAYFLLAMLRLLGLATLPAILATLAFAGFAAGFGPALDALTGLSLTALSNGSIGYVPAILALVGVAAGLLMPQTCALGPARRRPVAPRGRRIVRPVADRPHPRCRALPEPARRHAFPLASPQCRRALRPRGDGMALRDRGAWSASGALTAIGARSCGGVARRAVSCTPWGFVAEEPAVRRSGIEDTLERRGARALRSRAGYGSHP